MSEAFISKQKKQEDAPEKKVAAEGVGAPDPNPKHLIMSTGVSDIT